MGLKYTIAFSEVALADVEKWKKSGQKQVQQKISKLLLDMQEHPFTGIGKPEALKFELTGKFSRRINIEHRLIYEVDEENHIITVHSLIGHYK